MLTLTDNDLNDFEKRLKPSSDPFLQHSSSEDDDEDEGSAKPRFSTEADVLREKNRILMDKLFKAEKQTAELREAVEAVSGKAADLKDKKIIELVKKNRALQLQAESLKTKAAKAAEIAIKMKKDAEDTGDASSLKKTSAPLQDTTSMSMISGAEQERRAKELEKKVTKLRNEK